MDKMRSSGTGPSMTARTVPISTSARALLQCRAPRLPSHSARMAGWEYKFVDLFRGDQPHGSNGFEAFVEEIRLAGEDGWEAVGELSMSYHPEAEDDRVRSTVKTVLLKRPRD